MPLISSRATGYDWAMESLSQFPSLMLAEGALPGISGFLGTRGSLMLDVVVVAMLLIVPLLAISVYRVKFGRQYALHKKLQLAMAAVLLVAVLLFELDIRLNGWVERAVGSPYFDLQNKWSCPAGLGLIVHLGFAVPTLLLWIVVVVQALRKFSRPPLPGPHSRWHARWGMAAAIGMLMTAVTGWIFYWLAFVATAGGSLNA
jgi:putative membrane protein